MPEISRFLGIIIAMYYNDHAPSHFHAKYGSQEMKVIIATGEIIEGSPPKREQTRTRIVGAPQRRIRGKLNSRGSEKAPQ